MKNQTKMEEQGKLGHHVVMNRCYPKWRVDSFHRDEIKKVLCEKETDSSVWVIQKDYQGKVKVRMFAKKTNYRCYYDTWDDARNDMLSLVNSEIAYLQEKIKLAENLRQKILDLNCPDERENI